jgi:hypothetical protein
MKFLFHLSTNHIHGSFMMEQLRRYSKSERDLILTNIIISIQVFLDIQSPQNQQFYENALQYLDALMIIDPEAITQLKDQDATLSAIYNRYYDEPSILIHLLSIYFQLCQKSMIDDGSMVKKIQSIFVNCHNSTEYTNEDHKLTVICFKILNTFQKKILVPEFRFPINEMLRMYIDSEGKNNLLVNKSDGIGRDMLIQMRIRLLGCENPSCQGVDRMGSCVGCRSAFYCSKQCQIDDYKRHKNFCIPMDQKPSNSLHGQLMK